MAGNMEDDIIADLLGEQEREQASEIKSKPVAEKQPESPPSEDNEQVPGLDLNEDNTTKKRKRESKDEEKIQKKHKREAKDSMLNESRENGDTLEEVDIEEEKEELEDKMEDVEEKSGDEKENKNKSAFDGFSSDEDEDKLFGGSDDESEEEKQEKEEKEDYRSSLHDNYDTEPSRTNETLSTGEDMEIEYTEVPRPPKGAKLYFVKLPNLLAIEPRPFDAPTYTGEDEDEDEDTVSIKRLNPESVVRWREVKDPKDGTTVRQSNARFVRWSDGSLQLFLGGGEVFDVYSQAINRDNFHLFCRQKGLIQCHGKLEKKLFFNPADAQSKSHQKLTKAVVGQVKQKTRKVKVMSIPTVDPEKQKAKTEREEEARIRRDRKKLEELQRKKMNQYGLRENLTEAEAEASDEEQSGGEGEEERRIKRRRGADIDEQRILNAKESSSAPIRRKRGEGTGRKRSRKDEEDDLDGFIVDSGSEEEDQQEDEDEEVEAVASDEED